ncbi:hypothetical protein KI387_042418, partial [Taxus chinensis]
MVAESFVEEDEETGIFKKMQKLILDPNHFVGHRNVFMVAQGLSVVNILSNSSSQFILHKEPMDLEERLLSMQYHIHVMDCGIQALSCGLDVEVENQGVKRPEKDK